MVPKVLEAPLTATQADRKVMRTANRLSRLRKLPIVSGTLRLLRSSPQETIRSRNAAANERIRIIYRHVYYSEDSLRFPRKERPPGFSYQACLQNLLNTIAGSDHSRRVPLHIYYNGTAQQFATDTTLSPLERYSGQVEVKLVSAASALEAYLVMLRSVRDAAFEDSDIIYLLENDYLHEQNWVEETFRLFQSDVLFDFMSLYDHPDRYRIPTRYDQSKLFVTGSRHWVTAPSTCATFLLRYRTFLRDFNSFYTHKVDHKIFTQLVRSRGRILLTPVPGLATHCMAQYLDPLSRHLERQFNE